MSQCVLIVITGQPCTGKSALGRYLSARLSIPYISKDGIKETLFDTLGYSDRDWSRRLGHAGYGLLYYFAQQQLSAGRSLIIESNFRAETAAPILAALKAKHPFQLVQVLCQTDVPTLLARFEARAASAERHPGHVELQNLDEFRAALSGETCEPIPLEGKLITLDTTDFTSVDYAALAASIRADYFEDT